MQLGLSRDISSYILHEIANSIGSLNLNLELLETGQYSEDIMVLIKEIRLHCVTQIEYFRYLYGVSQSSRRLIDLIKLSQGFLKYHSIQIILLEQELSNEVIDNSYAKFMLAFIDMLSKKLSHKVVIKVNYLNKNNLKHLIIAVAKDSLKNSVLDDITNIFNNAIEPDLLINKIVAYYFQNLKDTSTQSKLSDIFQIEVNKEEIEFNFYV